MPDLLARTATVQDAPAIARIYNEGIADGTATFETRPRSHAEVEGWFGAGYPVVVVVRAGQVVAFASCALYRARECYAGIAEFSVYVSRETRGQGAGKLALQALLSVAEDAGFWKLVSRVLLDNAASRRLLAGLGFREVGVYHKHGRLGGVWRDVVIVEKLLERNLR